MPYDEADPQDPMMLVGVTLPGNPEAQREMAIPFAEEFARMGYGESQIMNLFREPFYGGANQAYRELGNHEVETIVQEAVGVWGRVGAVKCEDSPHTEPRTGEREDE